MSRRVFGWYSGLFVAGNQEYPQQQQQQQQQPVHPDHKRQQEEQQGQMITNVPHCRFG